jgi:hypothetical protein
MMIQSALDCFIGREVRGLQSARTGAGTRRIAHSYVEVLFLQ